MNGANLRPVIPAYDARNWYWAHADGHIYSSASQSIVAEDDAGYAAWRDAGYAATGWPRDGAGDQTDEALQEVLAPYGLSIPGVVIVPASVSRAQAKIALHRAGLLDMVKTAVSGDPELEIWFTDATTWERNNPHVVALGEELIGDTASVDALFVAAAQIVA
jgi:hypothetical protein